MRGATALRLPFHVIACDPRKHVQIRGWSGVSSPWSPWSITAHRRSLLFVTAATSLGRQGVDAMLLSKRAVASIGALGALTAAAAVAPSALAAKPPAQTISVVQFAPNNTALTVTEGLPGGAKAFVINRANSTGTAKFNVSPFDGSAHITDDYVPLWSNPVTIGPGATTATLLLGIVNDTVAEKTETMGLNLTSADALTQVGKKNSATVTITDNDPCPAVSVNDAHNTEGSPVTFTVSTAGATTCALPIQVHWATAAGGTAAAGTDYPSPQSGNVAIPSGATSTTFNVTTTQDTIDEPNETFNVALSAPVNTNIADGAGVGTIDDDDAAPTLSIADKSQAEGDSGQSGQSFTVSVSGPSASAIDVHWSTSAVGTAKGWNIGDARNDCAHNGSDGTDLVSAAGDLHFAASGSTPPSQTVTVQICGDTTIEGDETFLVELDSPSYGSLADGTALGTIQNDDADTDGDGVADSVDLCPGTPVGESVDANGCSASQIDTDGDGVYDNVDNCILVPNPGQEDVDGGGAGEPCDGLTGISGTSTGSEDGNDGSFEGSITNTAFGGVTGHPDGTYSGQFAASSNLGIPAACGANGGFFIDGTVTLTYGGNSFDVDLDGDASYFCVDVLGGTPADTSYTAHWEGSVTGGTAAWTGASGSVTYNGATAAQDGGGIRADTGGSWTGSISYPI